MLLLLLQMLHIERMAGLPAACHRSSGLLRHRRWQLLQPLVLLASSSGYMHSNQHKLSSYWHRNRLSVSAGICCAELPR